MKKIKLSFMCIFLPAISLAMDVTFEKDPSLPLVYLNLVIKGGAGADPSKKSGLTNFMGEMVLRGTRTRNKKQIDLELDQLGSTLAVETRIESMIIRGVVLSSQLESYLKLLEEVILTPSFPEVEIRKLKAELKTALLNELSNDNFLASRHFNRFLFGKHPYGNPILGKIEDLELITRSDVIRHYDRNVREKYLLFIGAGDSTTEILKVWAQRISKSRPSHSEHVSETIEKPTEYPKRRLLLVDKPERTQTQIYGGQVGILMTDPVFFPLYLGNFAFGGGSFSARMMVEIRVKRGWSYGANSYFRQGLQPRSWQFHLFPSAKDTTEALAYTVKMIENLREVGISKDEFEQAQKSLVNSAGFMFNTPKKRVENTLLERTLNLPEGFMKSYGPELSKVTLESVNASLKAFLRPEKISITVLCTANELREKLAQSIGVDAKDVEVRSFQLQ